MLLGLLLEVEADVGAHHRPLAVERGERDVDAVVGEADCAHAAGVPG